MSESLDLLTSLQVIREFLPGLEEKPCGDAEMATGTGVEHYENLVIDLDAGGLGYWLLIIYLGH